MINDGFADIVEKHRDQFPGFVAQVSLASPAGAVKEAKRAIDDLGACGVQVYTNVNGTPIDRPQYEEFWSTMEKIGKPIWIHPARTAERPDYVDEKKSLYEIWWTFGWSYETAAAMARLVFSKTIDRHPDLKLIVHHFGGIVPILEGRIGPGWDQLGARTSDEDYVTLRKSLKKRPLDYFKQNFYADTAVFGADAATVCGLAFYPTEKVRVRLRLPVRPGKGHRLHPRDAADSGVARSGEGREGEDLLQESGGDHGEDVREVRGQALPDSAITARVMTVS